MKYKFFTNSEKTWTAMFKSISEARKSIYLEMYIFQGNINKYNFTKLLIEKAKEGLQIKLILDSFGSFSLRKEEISEMRSAGIEILFLSYLLHRTHRKILIIDEKNAFIGGVNIHKESQWWNDLAIKIRGKLVKNIVESFIKSYINAGGKDQSIIDKNKKNILISVNAWIIDHSPIKKLFSLKKIYRDHISKTQKQIVLVTPYFMPRRWLQAALHQAVLRGVKVTILIPESTDHFIIDRVNYFYMYKMSKLGVEFYVEPEMNHAKAMILDEDECIIGSQNLDFLSFDYNSEVGVFFKDKEVSSMLNSILNKWKDESFLFDRSQHKPRWFDYIFSIFIKIFFRIF